MLLQSNGFEQNPAYRPPVLFFGDKKKKMKQKTLLKPLEIKGIGLHSGRQTTVKIKPADENTGILFEKDGVRMKALYQNVKDTQNCTLLEKDGVQISTIEHLMATLCVLGIDNALIECSSTELPILDGSAKEILTCFENAHLQTQKAPKRFLKVMKSVSFKDDKGNFIELCPPKNENLHIYFKIEFPSKIVGTQIFDGDITKDIFASKIAPCRTFCEKYQIDYLRTLGLIKGGSLDNAVVLDGEKILNEGGFRLQDECVGHKVLDLVGDLYTSGYALLADVKAYKTGHYHNNMVLRNLFETTDNYEIL